MNSEKLANKYRPSRLDQLIGQDIAVSKIRGMLTKGNIIPAILISGPYGTGKTSLARLIAKYINCPCRFFTYPWTKERAVCEEVEEHEPNEECPSCHSFRSGQIVDYAEVNCADTRGIDDMRQIIESSSFAPKTYHGKEHNNKPIPEPSSSYGFRVICLDEVQELPKQSISALLKPLEEPSPRTVWILCTTAKDKILPTIRSRCLDLTLRPVSNEAICDLIRSVNKKEVELGNSPKVPDPIIKQIAGLVDGHPRSALAALEGLQSVLQNKGADLAEAEVQQWLMDNVVGVNQFALATKFVASLLDGNPACIRMLDSVQDADQFINGCIRTIQSVCLGLGGSRRADPGAVQMIGAAKRKLSLKFTPTENNQGNLADVLGFFVTALQQARSGSDPAVSLDLAACKSLAVTTSWDKS